MTRNRIHLWTFGLGNVQRLLEIQHTVEELWDACLCLQSRTFSLERAVEPLRGCNVGLPARRQRPGGYGGDTAAVPVEVVAAGGIGTASMASC